MNETVSGIGYYTAEDFAKRGARVILACRNRDRAEEAKAKIVKSTGNGNVHVKLIDFGSLESIRDFAQDINVAESRLDILVNNAGAIGLKGFSRDGLLMMMQVNHFGTFLLTNLLLGESKDDAANETLHIFVI